jgi:hypothetical protein
MLFQRQNTTLLIFHKSTTTSMIGLKYPKTALRYDSIGNIFLLPHTTLFIWQEFEGRQENERTGSLAPSKSLKRCHLMPTAWPVHRLKMSSTCNSLNVKSPTQSLTGLYLLHLEVQCQQEYIINTMILNCKPDKCKPPLHQHYYLIHWDNP